MTVDYPTIHITLRDMTRADLRAVRRIESAAYEDAWPARAFDAELANAFAHYRVAVEAPTRSNVPSPRRGPVARLLHRLARAAGRRADARRIVGFMGVWYMQDQMHLVTIAAEPAQQGRGIGARLLLDCLDLARESELPEIVLEVRVSNTRAQSLYERFGFRRIGTLRAYYKDNDEDAYVMLCGMLTDPDLALRHATIRDTLHAQGRFNAFDVPPPTAGD